MTDNRQQPVREVCGGLWTFLACTAAALLLPAEKAINGLICPQKRLLLRIRSRSTSLYPQKCPVLRTKWRKKRRSVLKSGRF